MFVVSLCGQDSGNWESQILTIGRSATLCWNLVPPFQQIWQEYVLEVAKMFWLWNCYTLVLTSQDCLFLGCNAKHPPMMKSWCWLSRLFLIGMKNSCQEFFYKKVWLSCGPSPYAWDAWLTLRERQCFAVMLMPEWVFDFLKVAQQPLCRQVPRLSISIVILVLPSDICKLKSNRTNTEAVCCLPLCRLMQSQHKDGSMRLQWFDTVREEQ